MLLAKARRRRAEGALASGVDEEQTSRVVATQLAEFTHSDSEATLGNRARSSSKAAAGPSPGLVLLSREKQSGALTDEWDQFGRQGE